MRSPDRPGGSFFEFLDDAGGGPALPNASIASCTRKIESVACQLGNTKAVCRKSYVHPVILDAYLEGVTIQSHPLRLSWSKHPPGLTAGEWAVVNLLDGRVGKAKIASLENR